MQLHPTSLPGGRLGPEAYEFVDWLAEAGQSWWQMLPLGPPDRHGSPYKSASAFAAWPGLLADPEAPVSEREIAEFREGHGFWIAEWEAFHGKGAVADQVRFDREWAGLRRHAETRGVRLIGDVPIYVAPGSCDHRANPHLFQRGVVAGVPPDEFSETGQLWGNPLYDWPALRGRGYRWWIERLRRVFDLFDVVRIDHFRGFVAYWAVPEDAVDARQGHWRRGPGRAVFDAACRGLGELPVIAEDLGRITPPVVRLRRELGFPGMVVMQHAFDPDDPEGPHRMKNHRPDNIVYTGTHDNDTVLGWWRGIDAESRALAEAELERAGVRDDEAHWALIRLAFSSRGRVVMVQAQDVLGLDSEARMNVPGREGGNWGWRLPRQGLTADLAARLRAASMEAGRLAEEA